MARNTERSPRLHGRESEREALAELVSAARQGHGAVLVVRGEAGTGKTALLDYATGLAEGAQVVRAAGAQPETALAYAGLHQLCGSMTGLLGRLPAPQRAALETVFGVQAGAAADRFLVGLGILRLLTEAAAERPLVCVVDDAQWLDGPSAQALAFAGRRLRAAPAAVIFAASEPVGELGGLPELLLSGLPDEDARGLLADSLRWPLDEQVREQVVAETGGNPRLLLELRELTPTQLAGGFGLPGAWPPGQVLPRPVPAAVARQLGGLPVPAARLLAAAAADPTGDPALLWRAAGYLRVTSEAALPVAETGLVTFASRIVFRDRAVRAAAYHCASLRDRRAAHAALAQATDARADPDRRAWHRSHACGEPDEAVAADLERTAPTAQARGGLAAAAAFLERAALMTPDTGRRAARTLAAADAMVRAGEPGAVARLLAVAEPGVPDDHQRATADLVRSRLAAARNRGGDVPRLLADAAGRLDPADTAQVRGAYLDAIRAAAFAAGLASPLGTVTDVALAARTAPVAAAQGPSDLLLDGLSAYLGDERAAAAPALRRALAGFSRRMTAADLRWLPLACACALGLWDDAAADTLSGRFLQLARDEGAVGDLPLALNFLACRRLLSGDLDAAQALAAEAQAAAAATGTSYSPYGTLGLAALRGGREDALALISRAGQDAAERGEGLGAAAAQWASAVLHNGLGQYATALAAAEEAVRYAGPSVLASWPAAELVEAAARTGQRERAARPMSRLSEAASAAGTEWALGVRARSLALLSDGGPAEDLYLAAIGHLERSRTRVGLARAHLLYGEWLRRENRRVDAREQLRRAHGLFSAMGAAGFAERARRELLATGETVRRRTVETDRDLTAQESQIAVRARDGQTNTEIGAELFLSPRTVEWHLRKVFTKLGITSRRQLQHVLAAGDVPVAR